VPPRGRRDLEAAQQHPKVSSALTDLTLVVMYHCSMSYIISGQGLVGAKHNNSARGKETRKCVAYKTGMGPITELYWR
jgi:hypothetical protein